MEAALSDSTTTKDAAQCIIEQKHWFKARLHKMLMELGLNTYRQAREIMGDNLLGLPTAMQYFGSISPANMIALQQIPFDKETLKACSKTHILVADMGLSLLDVQQKARKGIFYEQDWYDGQEFVKRTETAHWQLIRKTPFEGSVSKNWSEQQALINDQINEIPSVRQVIYTMILHFLSTGERLFEEVFVRTCDVDSCGNRVYVGGFDEDGLVVEYWVDHARSGRIGVASARKP